MMDKLERRQRKLDEQAGTGKVDIGAIMTRLTREQMLSAAAEMLTDCCYETQPVTPIGGVTPDFRAQRKADSKTYDIVGLLCMAPEDVLPAYHKLVEMERALGSHAEYALAVHQMPEYLLYDVLEADKGRLYIDMKSHEYMMWVCYATPDGTPSMWCFMGGSRDKMLENRFAIIRQLTAEAVVGPRVTDMLMEEDGEDF